MVNNPFFHKPLRYLANIHNARVMTSAIMHIQTEASPMPKTLTHRKVNRIRTPHMLHNEIINGILVSPTPLNTPSSESVSAKNGSLTETIRSATVPCAITCGSLVNRLIIACGNINSSSPVMNIQKTVMRINVSLMRSSLSSSPSPAVRPERVVAAA